MKLTIRQMYIIPIASVLLVGTAAAAYVQPMNLDNQIKQAALDGDQARLIQLIDFDGVETGIRRTLLEQYKVQAAKNELAVGLDQGSAHELLSMAASVTAADLAQPQMLIEMYNDNPVVVASSDLDLRGVFRSADGNPPNYRYSEGYAGVNTYHLRLTGSGPEAVRYTLVAKRRGLGWRIVDVKGEVDTTTPLEVVVVERAAPAPQQYAPPAEPAVRPRDMEQPDVAILPSRGPPVPESQDSPREKILSGNDEFTFASPDGSVVCTLNGDAAMCGAPRSRPNDVVSCRPREGCEEFGVDAGMFSGASIMRTTDRISFMDGYSCVIMSQSSIDCRGWNHGVTMSPRGPRIY